MTTTKRIKIGQAVTVADVARAMRTMGRTADGRPMGAGGVVFPSGELLYQPAIVVDLGTTKTRALIQWPAHDVSMWIDRDLLGAA